MSCLSVIVLFADFLVSGVQIWDFKNEAKLLYKFPVSWCENSFVNFIIFLLFCFVTRVLSSAKIQLIPDLLNQLHGVIFTPLP